RCSSGTRVNRSLDQYVSPSDERDPIGVERAPAVIAKALKSGSTLHAAPTGPREENVLMAARAPSLGSSPRARSATPSSASLRLGAAAPRRGPEPRRRRPQTSRACRRCRFLFHDETGVSCPFNGLRS